MEQEVLVWDGGELVNVQGVEDLVGVGYLRCGRGTDELVKTRRQVDQGEVLGELSGGVGHGVGYGYDTHRC